MFGVVLEEVMDSWVFGLVEVEVSFVWVSLIQWGGEGPGHISDASNGELVSGQVVFVLGVMESLLDDISPGGEGGGEEGLF